MFGLFFYLRNMYDDIGSMWILLDEYCDFYIWNDVKIVFVRVVEVVGEKSFIDELVWLVSGSYVEFSFFSIIYEVSEFECL